MNLLSSDITSDTSILVLPSEDMTVALLSRLHIIRWERWHLDICRIKVKVLACHYFIRNN